MKPKTEAASKFAQQGISIAEWSRSHNFKVGQVRDVLRGKAKGNFGNSHKIAVALGIKPNSGDDCLLGTSVHRD